MTTVYEFLCEKHGKYFVDKYLTQLHLEKGLYPIDDIQGVRDVVEEIWSDYDGSDRHDNWPI